eukprot:scaffold70751_cov96-Phaeocystis_antarctica.AAC.1
MAPAWRRHQTAPPASCAFPSGGPHSAAARSKCVAASLNSTDERGPASQAPVSPLSTNARIWLAAWSGLGSGLGLGL